MPGRMGAMRSGDHRNLMTIGPNALRYNQLHLLCEHELMKRIRGKIEEAMKEDPESEPDKATDTWLLDGKLEEDVIDWESARPVFQETEIGAGIVEASFSGPRTFTIRTRGPSRLKKGDELSVDIRIAEKT